MSVTLAGLHSRLPEQSVVLSGDLLFLEGVLGHVFCYQSGQICAFKDVTGDTLPLPINGA